MALPRLVRRLSLDFRARRFAFFSRVLQLRPGMKVIDIGGTANAIFFRDRPDLEITYLNIAPGTSSREELRPNEQYIQADARALPIADLPFDIAFSNSLFEHVPREDWPIVAREIMRVATAYFVAVPYRYFPIQPHYNFPLAQFTPHRVQQLIALHWPFSYARGRDFSPVYLPARQDMRRVFPDAEMATERAGPLPKALYLWGRSPGT